MNIWGATSSKKNTRAIIAPTTTVIVVSDTIQKINQAVRRGSIPTYDNVMKVALAIYTCYLWLGVLCACVAPLIILPHTKKPIWYPAYFREDT